MPDNLHKRYTDRTGAMQDFSFDSDTILDNRRGVGSRGKGPFQYRRTDSDTFKNATDAMRISRAIILTMDENRAVRPTCSRDVSQIKDILKNGDLNLICGAVVELLVFLGQELLTHERIERIVRNMVDFIENAEWKEGYGFLAFDCGPNSVIRFYSRDNRGSVNVELLPGDDGVIERFASINDEEHSA
ncbi:MAG: hypothetical protein US89_C0002G0007 [Candidatus Peregrinibacteria bacterium GW2011_GWF2_38_29]|nr:MAG: hypothetical protein US89_C0002G0007 [Candidatus Peregrinibacteria bacterium GW2011_GWF2_38_29]HBB02163.1 hypothetical protein [Candidatus Peregrinibacteria bacterium]